MAFQQSRTRARRGGEGARLAVLDRVVEPANPSEVVLVADLRVDPAWHEVLRGGRQVQLTRLEFHLLYLLAQSANRVVPYASLIEQAWGYEAENSAESILKTPISRLRSKVGLHAPGPLTLESVARVGYLLRVAVPVSRGVAADRRTVSDR